MAENPFELLRLRPSNGQNNDELSSKVPPNGIIGRMEVTQLYPGITPDAPFISARAVQLAQKDDGTFELKRLSSNMVRVEKNGLRRNFEQGDTVVADFEAGDVLVVSFIMPEVPGNAKKHFSYPIAIERGPMLGHPVDEEEEIAQRALVALELDPDPLIGPEEDEERQTDDERDEAEAIAAYEAISSESSVLGGSEDEARLDSELRAQRLAFAKERRDKKRIAELKRQPAKLPKASTPRKRARTEERSSGSDEGGTSKGPKTEYGRFAKEARKRVSKENPEASRQEITAMVRQLWKERQDGAQEDSNGSEDE